MFDYTFLSGIFFLIGVLFFILLFSKRIEGFSTEDFEKTLFAIKLIEDESVKPLIINHIGLKGYDNVLSILNKKIAGEYVSVPPINKVIMTIILIKFLSDLMKNDKYPENPKNVIYREIADQIKFFGPDFRVYREAITYEELNDIVEANQLDPLLPDYRAYKQNGFSLKPAVAPASSVTTLSKRKETTTDGLNGINEPKPLDETDITRIVRKELQDQKRIDERYDKPVKSITPKQTPQKKLAKSPGLSQGNEYNKNSDKGCNSPEYIRKDQIPCWGCTI